MAGMENLNHDSSEHAPVDGEDNSRDPQDKIWSVYVSETVQRDKALAERWKGDMDGILIFAGLFSATLTAFLTVSYKNLQQDPADLTVVLLTQISQQLANSSLVVPATAPKFKPPPSALRVNAYWFLSLACSLLCALGATLVQQWARSYEQSVERHSISHKRARIRAYLMEGVETFGVTALVNSIPVLLHISVFLFMIGLFEFLFSTDPTIAYLILGIIGVLVGLYLIFTLLPLLYQNCPYGTPLSMVCWSVLRTLHLLRFRDDKGSYEPIKQGLSRYRAYIATKPSPARRARDEKALRGLLESFTGDSDFELVIAGIPDFLLSQDDNPGITLWERFQSKDITLCTRITNLLVTCQSGGVLTETARHRRAQTCLNAIWSLTQNSLLPPHQFSPGPGTEAPQISSWSINEATVAAISALKHDHAPAIAIYVTCTTAVISCKILEHWSIAQEVELFGTLKVLELLDIYKFLPQQLQLSLLQQRKQEWELKQESTDPVQELKYDPTLGQELKQELELLKQDGYFGVLVAFINSLSDLKNLSILSGLPLASKTLDVIIPRFPRGSPSTHTQRLLIKCLHRAIGNDLQHDRPISEPEDHHLSEERRKGSFNSDFTAVASSTKLPVSLIDHFLFAVVRSLEDEALLEEAKTLISDYRERHSDSIAAAKSLLTLENGLKKRSNPTEIQ